MASSVEEKFRAIKIARQYQQRNYELFPDWFEYDSQNYDLIQHKIGYAIFGLPEISENNVGSPSTSNKCSFIDQSDNIFGKIVYTKEKCKIINTIHKKIIEYGKYHENTIQLGIIYNMVFLHEIPKKLLENSNNPNSEVLNKMCIFPLFKLRKLSGVWYIDIEGRVYKSWQDYLKNNMLPKCTMILPKSGLYQCDPNSNVSEYFSNVWLEIVDSSECTAANKVFKGLDITATAASVCATVGLSVASFFTPIGPAILTAGTIPSLFAYLWPYSIQW